MTTLNVRLPEKLNDTLTDFAQTLGYPKGRIVRTALDEYLQKLQRLINETEKRHAELSSKAISNKFPVSTKEIRSILDSIKTIHGK